MLRASRVLGHRPFAAPSSTFSPVSSLSRTSAGHHYQRRALSLTQELALPLSYVKGATENVRPLCEDSIGTFWDRQVDRYGDRLGLVVKHEQDLHWTFREFGDQVDYLCRGLYESGLRKGDRLA